MQLVVGGVGSGKRDYVQRELGFSPEDIAEAVLDSRPVLAGLERLLREEGEVDSSLLPLLLEKAVVIVDEVGSGVVPLSPGEREWRERVGRLTQELARRSSRVVRLCCGLPLVLKEEQ